MNSYTIKPDYSGSGIGVILYCARCDNSREINVSMTEWIYGDTNLIDKLYRRRGYVSLEGEWLCPDCAISETKQAIATELRIPALIDWLMDWLRGGKR